MAHPGGRPSSYRPELCESIVKYFKIPSVKYVTEKSMTAGGKITEKKVAVPNDTPYLVDWCDDNDICVSSMHNWTKQYPEFMQAYLKAKKYLEKFLLEAGLKEAHHPYITALALKNLCGWRDQVDIKTDTTINVTVENKSSNEFMNKEENRVARLIGQAN
jgi:hypothetical protein